MRALDDTVATLGSPLIVRTLLRGAPEIGMVARWRHGGAAIDLPPSNAVRIAMSLVDRSGTRSREGASLADGARVGSVSVFPPGDRVSVAICGEADVLQLFLRWDYAEGVVGRSLATASLHGFNDPGVQALLIQILVSSAGAGDVSRAALDRKLKALFERIERRAREVDASASARFAVGGLRPTAFRRVEARLEAAVEQGSFLTVADLARAAGVSVTHFARSYRRQVGTTPHRQLTARRMERAISLLRSAAMPVAEVADRTGFSSPAHFVATFRRHLGATPGAVRDAMSP